MFNIFLLRIIVFIVKELHGFERAKKHFFFILFEHTKLIILFERTFQQNFIKFSLKNIKIRAVVSWFSETP